MQYVGCMIVLMVLHRMHPNLREVKTAIESAGGKLICIVASSGPSEVSDPANRILLTPTSVQESGVNNILDIHNPDVLIQRNFDQGFIQFWRIARQRGITCFRYSQDPAQVPYIDVWVRPLRVARFVFHSIYFRAVLGRHKRLTPVAYWGRPTRLMAPNSIYVPLPMRARTQKDSGLRSVLTVVCVAKHGQRRKRVNWVIKVLRNSRIPFRLILVGAKPDASNKKYCAEHRRTLIRLEELKHRSNLATVEYDLTEEQLFSLYQRCDVFVLPAKRELMAISPLEAMSVGLPVLIGSDGGAVSYVRPVGKATVFRVRSFKSFESALNRMLASERLRRELSDSAGSVVARNHHPKKFLEALMRAVDSTQ